MFCRNCGEPLNDIQDFCLKCGVAKGKGENFCSHCGSSVNPNQAVCLQCGFAIQQQRQTSSSNTTDEWMNPRPELKGQSKLVMALICFFIGGFGVHNFMMGENKKGIGKILLSLLCGIGWIWALVDFINILTDKYVAQPD